MAAVLAGLTLHWTTTSTTWTAGRCLPTRWSLPPRKCGTHSCPRVHDADIKARLNLVPAGRCLWGGIVAGEEGWTPETHWWYFEKPRYPGPRLQQELDGM